MEYSKNEIEIIVNNCKTEAQLYDVCLAFKYLIEFKHQAQTLHMHITTHLKLRQLIKE